MGYLFDETTDCDFCPDGVCEREGDDHDYDSGSTHWVGVNGSEVEYDAYTPYYYCAGCAAARRGFMAEYGVDVYVPDWTPAAQRRWRYAFEVAA